MTEKEFDFIINNVINIKCKNKVNACKDVIFCNKGVYQSEKLNHAKIGTVRRSVTRIRKAHNMLCDFVKLKLDIKIN